MLPSIIRFLPLVLLLAWAAPAAAESSPRLVAVSGSGEVVVVPDRASVSVAVEARHKQLDQARAEVAKTVTQVLALTDSLGLERKHVGTSSLTLRPEYQWIQPNQTRGGQGERRLIGYFVQRQVVVNLQDLEKLGPLLEGAISVGINNVSEPQFSASNEPLLRRQALAKAAHDAKANAEVLAGTLGAKLGPVHSISAGQVHTPQPHPVAMKARMSMAAAESSDASGSYETGEIRITANVNAEFSLQ